MREILKSCALLCRYQNLCTAPVKIKVTKQLCIGRVVVQVPSAPEGKTTSNDVDLAGQTRLTSVAHSGEGTAKAGEFFGVICLVDQSGNVDV